MEKQIKISKFHITAKGDESVGIFPVTWTIEPEMYFDEQDDLDNFKNDLTEVFQDYCGDNVFVETQEEINAQEAIHEEITKQMVDEEFDDNFIDEFLDRNNKKE